MNIDQLKKVISASAEVINVVAKVINKEGIMVLFQALDELTALGNLDAALLKQEISDLDQAEKDELVALFKSKLQLPSAELEKKIESGVDLLGEAVDVVVSALNVVNKVKVLFQ